MKKVLIITYYWPPSAGAGVQRWLKFSKYLPKFNWKPIIYTPANPYFDLKDSDLNKDVSSELVVWKKNIWEPYSLKDKIFGQTTNVQNVGIIQKENSFKVKLTNWIRGNIFIPDPKIFWVKPSINFLLDKIKKEEINHIITTGPPHSMHLIGLGIKKKLPHIKWITDFRDPWSKLDLLNDFHLSSFAKRRHFKLEKKVLKESDLTLTVSETWQNDLKKLGAKKVELVTNGFDEEDFTFRNKKIDKFIIGHFGLINHLRNPKNLWFALNQLCLENKNFSNDLEIHLAGSVDNDIIDEIYSYPILKSKLKLLGYLNHKQVITCYNNSSILLLLLFNSKSGIGNYPGKIFEYFASKKPILAFGPKNSDSEKLINKTKSGIYIDYDQIQIKSKILSLFNTKDNNRTFDTNKISQYSRKNLTNKLADILDKI